jgi:hypothetical protein
MTTIFVEFSDATKSAVIGYAASPQPAESWPYQGEIDTSDPLWKTYYDSKDDLSKIGLPAPD